MPQPFRGSGLSFGPDKVLQRPQLAAHIGNIVSAWTHLEETIIMVFAQAVRGSLTREQQAHHVTDVLSWQIFNSMYVISQKIDVTKKALSNLDDKKHLEAFKNIEKDIRKCNDARNDIVHNRWGITGDEPDALILAKRGGRSFTYKERDFVELANRMHTTMLCLIKIMKDIPFWKDIQIETT